MPEQPTLYKMPDSIYIAPDLRSKTLQEAEEFLQSRRSARMVVVQTAKMLAEEKRDKLVAKELTNFEKQLEMLERDNERIVKAIDTYKTRLEKLKNIDHAIRNASDIL